jgi:transposase-like protein
MVHKQDITCPHCGDNDLRKHGRSCVGTQRWRCQGCVKSFQLAYAYKANEPGVKEQIDAHALNGSGVRDTARLLGINPNTVCRHLKKKPRPS